MFGEMQKKDKQGDINPNLRHGRLWRSRIEAADSSASPVCAA
jgi:hypothetical protein